MKFVWFFAVLTMCIVNSLAELPYLYTLYKQPNPTSAPSYEQKMRNYPEMTYEYAQSYSRQNARFYDDTSSTMESVGDISV